MTDVPSQEQPSYPNAGGPHAAQTVAEIDLDAIAANVRTLQGHADGRPVMAVMKADGYGHGIIRSALAALDGGAAWLGTSSPYEALQLRSAGIKAPIVTWLWSPDGPWDEVIENDVDISIAAGWGIEKVVAAAKRTGRKPRVQLKVDTGLSRNGCPYELWPDLLAMAKRAEDAGLLTVSAIWSHLACADEPEHASVRPQMELFDRALGDAARAGIDPEIRHLANSAATLFLGEAARYDMVRPGLSVFGLSPAPQIASASDVGLVPAMTLKARVALTKFIEPGAGVAYGHDWHAGERTEIALIPLGYADGIFRHASGRGEIAIEGRRYKMAGRVMMDQFVVELGRDRSAAVNAGDEAIVFGPGKNGEPLAQDWADAAGTIVYEIVTRVGHRVERRTVSRSRTRPATGSR